MAQGQPKNHKKVAFFTGMSPDYGPVLQNTDLVMSNVVTNVGKAYATNTGRFKAPVRATYQFNVTIAAQLGRKAAVRLIKNETWIFTVRAECTTLWATATSSNVAILSLEAGEEVWLRLLSEASHVRGYMFTTFSGFLICEN